MNPTDQLIADAETLIRSPVNDGEHDICDDFDRLLAGIRDEPGCDARRGAFADWLEEHAGTVPCGECKGNAGSDVVKDASCPHCRGVGVKDGREAWAEFVRVQILASQCEVCHGKRTFSYGDYLCSNCQPHYDRERELWPAVVGNFLPPSGAKWLPMLDGPDAKLLTDARTQMPLLIVRRGIPAVVRCNLQEWRGGECSCENGSVDTGGSTPWGEPISERCPACSGTGRIPGIGPRLAQTWPVVEVVTELKPWYDEYSSNYVWWPESGWRSRGEEAGNIPDKLFDCIAAKHTEMVLLPGSWSSEHLSFPTEAAANAAVSDALLAEAKNEPQRP